MDSSPKNWSCRIKNFKLFGTSKSKSSNCKKVATKDPIERNSKEESLLSKKQKSPGRKSIKGWHKRLKNCFTKNKTQTKNTEMSLDNMSISSHRSEEAPYLEAIILSGNPNLGTMPTNDSETRNSSRELSKKQMSTEYNIRKEIRNLTQNTWYWGGISKTEADDKLEGTVDGSFLIRDSVSKMHTFTISFRSVGITLHSRIERTTNGYKLFDQRYFPTIKQLVEYAMKQSKKGILCYSENQSEPNYPVRMLRPISRNDQVKSLQNLSRFTIRQYVDFDDIELLHLPNALLSYLKENNYII